MRYRRKLIKVTRMVSVVLVLSILNLNLVIPGYMSEKHSDVCSCYTEHGICSVLHICDCCKEKRSIAEQEEKACHHTTVKHSEHKKNKSMRRAVSDTVTICRLGCSEAKDGFVMPPVSDPRILAKSPSVEPDRAFLICEIFPLQKHLTPYIEPPEKPPRFTT